MAILLGLCRYLVIAIMFGITSLNVCAGEKLDARPAQPDPSAKYLFYLHGRYVERHGDDGNYEYTGILNALAKKGLVVVGEVRSATDPGAYSKYIASQVEGLLNAGVPAENITVAGHSKGGFISMLSASRVQNEAIKYAILAGCGVEGSKFRRSYLKFSRRHAMHMRGHFLVAWDADDNVTRECDLAMGKAGVEFQNLIFETGSGHQLFYEPKPVWIDPLAEFALSE
jgi:hypothetical protein